MMRRAPLLLAAALASWALASPARANVVEDLSIEQMALRAEVVVHGRVASVTSEWSDDGTRILTHARVAVRRYLAGEGPSELVVTQVGGRVGDTTLTIAGAPSFEEGAEVVLFLVHPSPEAVDRLVVLGMAAGLFRVAQDRATGETVLARDLQGLTRIRLSPVSEARPRALRPLLLRELADRVRRTRAEGGER